MGSASAEVDAPVVLCSVVVPGEPQPKERARVGAKGGKTPQRTVDAEARIGWAVKAAMASRGHGLPLPGRFRLALYFASKWPEGDGRAADGDNCEKLCLDALTGVVWLDDAQVVDVHWRMVRGVGSPWTQVVIARDVTAEENVRAGRAATEAPPKFNRYYTAEDHAAGKPEPRWCSDCGLPPGVCECN